MFHRIPHAPISSFGSLRLSASSYGQARPSQSVSSIGSVATQLVKPPLLCWPSSRWNQPNDDSRFSVDSQARSSSPSSAADSVTNVINFDAIVSLSAQCCECSLARRSRRSLRAASGQAVKGTDQTDRSFRSASRTCRRRRVCCLAAS